jgi:hypothetical protein
MAKSTKKSGTPVEAPKPAVRRSRTTRTAAVPAEAPAMRRAASPRRKKVVDVTDDRGLSAAAAARASAAASAEPTHDEIATRAYFIHQRRNGAAGDQVNDWLQAVAELRGERGLI